MNENQVPGTAGGTHVAGAPLTTTQIEQASPELLRNDIDRRIVKVRPMSTPIDQLSRCGNIRRADSMTVEYYSVDTKATETTVKETYPGGEGQRISDDIALHVIKTDADAIFDVSETILVPDVAGYAAEGEEAMPLVLYVTGKGAGGGIEVSAVNPPVVGMEGERHMPRLSKGVRLVRMGRAATELDVQTPQFAALPRKARNNCQIFKMQVEQSTLARLAGKEVEWSLSDQEEAAIIDMRLGMEKSFIFGSPARIFDTTKNEYIYLTGGIWGQAPRNHKLKLEGMTENDLVALCSAAFTGNNGSKRKILIAGTGLMEALSKLEHSKVIRSGETKVKWGIEFKEFVSNFGTLYIVHSEIFDQCGHVYDGFVVDPNYITKYVHVPFSAERLDLRRSGQRNTDAVVITEASCLVLRYPNAHMRVTGVL
ncbi:MAG: DUF5309 domain-containing protein [Muribaculaceae bacterium]|nr:DUF5309 domain-containing protein [Muribaculaceae bacterium]